MNHVFHAVLRAILEAKVEALPPRNVDRSVLSRGLYVASAYARDVTYDETVVR